ncbi:TadE/TadG family type IV pilus assembly protein [Pseudoduganella sp. UC29_106]|uniref:TadE/TadG family type IV pilus assembly protein n=1 Tax=Pseudoduganella sp. UC29_106 TaxID=3374553 RepID=UPI0037568DD0
MATDSQRGVVAVEFALCIIVFLMMVFATIEYARMMYLWNTQQEVVRRAARAAATADFADAGAMQALRRSALFRADDGALALAPGVTPDVLRIEYLSLSAAGTLAPLPVLPGCPARNVVNCNSNPYGASCIRFVRVRLCADGAGAGGCPPLPYVRLMPLVPVPAQLPPSTLTMRAESLGFRPGDALCP